jgi:hypothetical protein
MLQRLLCCVLSLVIAYSKAFEIDVNSLLLTCLPELERIDFLNPMLKNDCQWPEYSRDYLFPVPIRDSTGLYKISLFCQDSAYPPRLQVHQIKQSPRENKTMQLIPCFTFMREWQCKEFKERLTWITTDPDYRTPIIDSAWRKSIKRSDLVNYLQAKLITNGRVIDLLCCLDKSELPEELHFMLVGALMKTTQDSFLYRVELFHKLKSSSCVMVFCEPKWDVYNQSCSANKEKRNMVKELDSNAKEQYYFVLAEPQDDLRTLKVNLISLDRESLIEFRNLIE